MDIQEDKKNYHSYFPYPQYRKGQEELIKSINLSLNERHHYVLIAPNGTGKSIIGLSSILPLIYEKDLKLIYLCRTHQQNDRIIKELKKIKKKQSRLNGISLRGRDSVCINEDLLKERPTMEELMRQCEELRKKRKGCPFYQVFKSEDEGLYFLEANCDPKLEASIRSWKNRIIEYEELYTDCKAKGICPYYFMRVLLRHMRIIVCNYIWVFNPFIRNLVLLRHINKEIFECVIVVDECHNLTDAVLDINEQRLLGRTLLNCRSLLEEYRTAYVQKFYFRAFERFLNQVFDFFEEQTKKCQKKFQKEREMKYILEYQEPIAFLSNLMENAGIDSIENLAEVLGASRIYAQEIYNTISISTEKTPTNWLGLFISFWEVWILNANHTHKREKHFFGYFAERFKNTIYLRLLIRPYNPKEYIFPVLNSCFASLHLSGTLIPHVYEDLTSLNETRYPSQFEQVKSPFDSQNINTIIVKDVSSRYFLRNRAMIKKIIDKLEEIIASRNTNIGIFTTSYSFSKKFNSKKLGNRRLIDICEKYGRRFFQEKRGRTSRNNSLMIENFKSEGKRNGAVLFGVLGGRNSEGEDYPGRDMEMVVIVGFPYAFLDDYIENKIAYFNRIFNGNGYFYAYKEPAFRRANQAAGRPIRKISDKGAIIFLEERYAKPDYLPYLSDWLKEKGVLTVIEGRPNELFRHLTSFWS